MEHESEPTPGPTHGTEQQDDPPGREPPGCGKIILWIIVGGVVIFLAGVAFVFGACMLG